MRLRPFRLLAALLCGVLLAACADPGPPAGGSVAELQRIDLKAGTGAVASSGDEVSVHYTGWLYDENAPDQRGEQFDSSRSEEHTSELQSLMRTSYAVCCLKKKQNKE